MRLNNGEIRIALGGRKGTLWRARVVIDTIDSPKNEIFSFDLSLAIFNLVTVLLTGLRIRAKLGPRIRSVC